MNYPKYLAKYSLLKLQFNDIMFRKTFMYQIMVFVDWIRNPIKGTTMEPKIDEGEIKFTDYIFARAQLLMNQSEETASEGSPKTQDQGFDYSSAFTHMIEREIIWSKSKEQTRQTTKTTKD